MMKEKVIRASYDRDFLTVYQAYKEEIARPALENQSFASSPFKKGRMTWIKPSFLWMMYRSGWATKMDQEYVLAIKIKREGFEWALQNSCLSSFDGVIHSSYEHWKEKKTNSPVIIQWDPEKDISLQSLPFRSIQIGLSGVSVEKYISDWCFQIDDITNHCKTIRQLVLDDKIDQARELLPVEKLYPLPDNIKNIIGHSSPF